MLKATWELQVKPVLQVLQDRLDLWVLLVIGDKLEIQGLLAQRVRGAKLALLGSRDQQDLKERLVLLGLLDKLDRQDLKVWQDPKEQLVPMDSLVLQVSLDPQDLKATLVLQDQLVLLVLQGL